MLGSQAAALAACSLPSRCWPTSHVRSSSLLQIGNLTKWLKGLPLARRPLVKLNAKVAPEPAVKMLQAALPPRGKEQAAVELENVAATLLLPPTGALGLGRGLGCGRTSLPPS